MGLNYEEHKIYLNGFRVKFLCLVGLAVELFLKMAFGVRRGLNALRWHDVGDTIEIRHVVINDRNRSSVHVDLPRSAAVLALRVSHAVVAAMEQRGDMRVLDAIVPEKDANGDVVSEHDVVAERRGEPGKSSVEIKCRQIKDDRYTDSFRRQLQNESMKLWKAATAPLGHQWAERVVVLVEWGKGPLDGNFKAIRAESLPLGSRNLPENWNVLWGWRGRLASPQSSSVATPRPLLL